MSSCRGAELTMSLKPRPPGLPFAFFAAALNACIIKWDFFSFPCEAEKMREKSQSWMKNYSISEINEFQPRRCTQKAFSSLFLYTKSALLREIN